MKAKITGYFTFILAKEPVKELLVVNGLFQPFCCKQFNSSLLQIEGNCTVISLSLFSLPSDYSKVRHGKFGKVDRSPEIPSERLSCCTLSQWPRKTVGIVKHCITFSKHFHFVYCEVFLFQNSFRMKRNAIF